MLELLMRPASGSVQSLSLGLSLCGPTDRSTPAFLVCQQLGTTSYTCDHRHIYADIHSKPQPRLQRLRPHPWLRSPTSAYVCTVTPSLPLTHFLPGRLRRTGERVLGSELRSEGWYCRCGLFTVQTILTC